MSLESKIEQLTAAIEKLNANITLVLNTPVGEVITPVVIEDEKTAPNKPDAMVETKAVTHEDVQAAIMAKVRLDMQNKTAVKAILAEFKAAKVSDLGADALAVVMLKVGAL